LSPEEDARGEVCPAGAVARSPMDQGDDGPPNSMVSRAQQDLMKFAGTSMPTVAERGHQHDPDDSTRSHPAAGGVSVCLAFEEQEHVNAPRPGPGSP